MLRYFYILFIIIINVLYCNELYSKEKPSEIVIKAFNLLKKVDYNGLLLILEGKERNQALQILKNISTNTNAFLILKKESENLIDIKILKEEFYTNDITNQIAVVQTRWEINPAKYAEDNVKIIIEDDEGNNKKNYVYVDYLLKKYGDNWKIISRKTK